MAPCFRPGAAVAWRRAILFVPALLALLSGLGLRAEQEAQLEPLLAGAKQAQANGDFPTAAADYRQAVALSPGIAELWANLGLMNHQCGRYEEAIKSFERAIALKNSLFVPNLFLGIDFVQLKHDEQALPYLRRAAALNPNDAQAPLALGRAYTALKNTRAASDAFAAAGAIDSRNSDAWFGLGLVSLEQVEVDARILTNQYPDSSYIKLLAGEAFSNEGKPVEAATAYESALNSPDIPSCSLADFGFTLLHNGDATRAVAAFHKSSSAGCALATLGLVRADFEQSVSKETWNRLQQVWASDREIVRANAGSLWAGLSSDRRERVMSSLNDEAAGGAMPSDLREVLISAAQGSNWQTAAMQMGNDNQSHRGRQDERVSSTASAEYAFYSGEYRRCSFEARKLVASPKTRVAGLYWEIRSDQRLAIFSLLRAAEAAPDSAKVHVLIGDVYRQRQHYAEAEGEYQKALTSRPDEPGALLGLATAYFMEAKFDDSLSTAQMALSRNPDDPKINLLVGEVLVERHEYPEAEAHLKRIAGAEPEIMPRVHALLGRCYSGTGQISDAIKELEAGQSSDDDGSIHYQLYRLYQKSGNAAAAAAALKVSQDLHRDRLKRAAIAIQETGLSPPSEEKYE